PGLYASPSISTTSYFSSIVFIISLLDFTPKDNTNASAFRAVVLLSLVFSISISPSLIFISLLQGSKVTPFLTSLMLISTILGTYPAGPIFSAISITVTLFPLVANNSATSKPVIPEPATTTFLFSNITSSSKISVAVHTESFSIPSIGGITGIDPVEINTAYGLISLIFSIVAFSFNLTSTFNFSITLF